MELFELIDKNRKWFLIGGLIIILVSTMWFIAIKYKVYGGNLACFNSGGVLIEGFKCDIPETVNQINNSIMNIW